MKQKLLWICLCESFSRTALGRSIVGHWYLSSPIFFVVVAGESNTTYIE